MASAEQAAREAVGSRLPSGSVAAHGALYGGHVAEIDSKRASVRAAALEAFVFKGGWLYKLRDKFPRRWQRRYFALTRDYRLLYFKQPPHDARDLEQPQGAVDLHGCKWGVLPEEAAVWLDPVFLALPAGLLPSPMRLHTDKYVPWKDANRLQGGTKGKQLFQWSL